MNEHCLANKKRAWINVLLKFAAVVGLLLTTGVFLQVKIANADVEENVPLQPENLVAWGLTGYYKVYGEWPQGWYEVVSAGIVQAQLSIPGSGWVNPDDGRLDFKGDVIYLGPDGTGGCTIESQMVYAEGTHRRTISPVRPYRELLSTLDDRAAAYGDDRVFEQIVNDERWLRLFAATGVLDLSIKVYAMSSETGFPITLDEYLSSGFSPLNYSSVNPVTGRQFTFSGDPEDIWINIPEDVYLENDPEAWMLPAVSVVSSNARKYGLGMY